jgi:hypothetical protein
MRSGDVHSPPSLFHKQTELCICGNVVLYINSASYIAEMVLMESNNMVHVHVFEKKLIKNDFA